MENMPAFFSVNGFHHVISFDKSLEADTTPGRKIPYRFRAFTSRAAAVGRQSKMVCCDSLVAMR
jgi:hypothetical protein